MKCTATSVIMQSTHLSNGAATPSLTCDALVVHLQVVAELVAAGARRDVRLHDGARARRVADARRPVVDEVHRIVDAVADAERAVGGGVAGVGDAGGGVAAGGQGDAVERPLDVHHVVERAGEGDAWDSATLETLAGAVRLCNNNNNINNNLYSHLITQFQIKRKRKKN